jgi:cyclophilin family peptidyl-prolyl cis-trans isomerase
VSPRLHLLVAGCGGDDSSSGQSAAETPSGPPQLDPGKTYVATVSTSKGDFEITLDAKQPPITRGSFKSLADKAGFVIQGGDPNGDGTCCPVYSVVEAPPSGLKYTKGVVAMAKTQDEAPGTSGSQFFVVTAQDAQLPPDYALLGRVTSGSAVVDKISKVKTDPNTEAPLKPVTIKSITVEEQ